MRRHSSCRRRAKSTVDLIWSNAARFVNWSDAQRICPNALRIWPNGQIGQMRLTSLHPTVNDLTMSCSIETVTDCAT